MDGRDNPRSDDLETELTLKYIKQSCGPPPPSADVQVTFEESEAAMKEMRSPIL